MACALYDSINVLPPNITSKPREVVKLWNPPCCRSVSQRTR